MELYVHIPFCVRKCEYCDFLSAPADERLQNRYVGALLHEIRYYGQTMGRPVLSTIYIGGGTPSLLAPEYIALLLKQIQVSFEVEADAETTIECNPGTLNEEKLLTYKEVGINRLSIGLQSAFDDELKILGRIHTYRQFLENYECARRCGFENINVDLMSALPYQSTEKFVTSLKRVIALKPEHISAYSLIIEKGTPFYDLYKFDAVRQEAGMQTESLPTEEEEYQTTKMTQHILKEAGYHWYEVSNFAKPGYECRHNIGYWKRVDYLGVGLGASSLIDNVRYSNTRDLYTYLSECENIHDCYMQYPLTEGVTGSAVSSADGTHILVPAVNLHAAAEQTTRNEQMEEFMFLGLRMRDGFYREEFTQAFGIPIEAVYGDALNHLQQEELLLKREGRIYLTDKGMDLNNYVVAQFML